MPYFVLYTALLLLGCFFVGACLACLTRKVFGGRSRPAVATAGAGAAALAGAGAVVHERTSGGIFGARDPAGQAAPDREAFKDDPVPATATGLAPGSALEPAPAPVLAPAAEAPVLAPVAAATVSPAVDEVELPAVVNEPVDPGAAIAAASAAATAAVATARATTAALTEAASPVGEAALEGSVQPAAVSATEILPSPDIDDFEKDTGGSADTELEAAGTTEPEPAPVMDQSVEEEPVEAEAVEADAVEDEPGEAEALQVEPAAVEPDTVEPADGGPPPGQAGIVAATGAGTAAIAGSVTGTGEAASDAAGSNGTSSEIREVAATAPPAAGASGDDLLRIRGVDPEANSILRNAGIFRYDQLAALTAADVNEIDGILRSPARISREGWIEQAAILSAGGETYFSERQHRKSSGSGGEGVQPADSPSSARAAVGGITGAMVPGLAPQPVPADADDLELGAPEQRPETEGREPREDRDPRADRELRGGREPRAPRAPRPERELRDERAPREDRVRRDNAGERDQDPARNPGQLRSTRSGRTADTSTGSPERRRVDGGGQMLRSSEPDDLKRIRGVGVVIEKKLNAMGIHSYAQVAAWEADDIQRVNAVLDFSGRIERENWIEQAKMLSGKT